MKQSTDLRLKVLFRILPVSRHIISASSAIMLTLVFDSSGETWKIREFGFEMVETKGIGYLVFQAMYSRYARYGLHYRHILGNGIRYKSHGVEERVPSER